ncbi:alpha/beta hydrolase [Kovacikia minuta CCNUW1]|uniref:alpha/beta hydrolase n=1 Tax=Kovacikia minuta TaxID=2931930 RepID=UPI001CCCF338|nr:alpha/beta hydrolase [Kovacikia minuta]UBF25370.1 alpha/beta hydrolase [Kovacikia minuta CCNUW1]
MTLQAISVPPASGQPATGVIVLLHGWGANYQDLLGLAPYLDLPTYQFVFPDAPFPHPFNPVGRMWYEFPEEYRFLGKPEFRDRPDLSTSRNLLIDFLKSLPEQTGVPLAHTVLGGFSQGGAMTLDVGLNFPLAGLMVLSGYLHAPLQPQTSSFPPVLMVHGRQDQVVPLVSAHQARASLQSLGVEPEYHEYNMGHEIQPIVLEQMQIFVKEGLSGKE